MASLVPGPLDARLSHRQQMCAAAQAPSSLNIAPEMKIQAFCRGPRKGAGCAHTKPYKQYIVTLLGGP